MGWGDRGAHHPVQGEGREVDLGAEAGAPADESAHVSRRASESNDCEHLSIQLPQRSKQKQMKEPRRLGEHRTLGCTVAEWL